MFFQLAISAPERLTPQTDRPGITTGIPSRISPAMMLGSPGLE